VHKDKDGPLRSLREKEVEPVPRRMAIDTVPVWDIAEDLLFGQVCILVYSWTPIQLAIAQPDTTRHSTVPRNNMRR